MNEHEYDDLGELGQKIKQLHERLKPGGPEVNYEQINLLVSGELNGGEIDVVKANICTWKNWHDAYREVHGDMSNNPLTEGDMNMMHSPEMVEFVKDKMSELAQMEPRKDDHAQWEEKIRQYWELDESELREELWEEMASSEVELVRTAGHPFDPYVKELRRVVCHQSDWAKRRDNPQWNDPLNLAIALADAMFVASISIPFPLTLTAVTIIKMGLDQFCEEGKVS